MMPIQTILTCTVLCLGLCVSGMAGAANKAVLPPGAPVPPGKYPRLTVTAEELAQVQEKAHTRPELKAALDEMIAQGKEALSLDVSSLPPKDSDAHYGLSKDACHLGYAALLSGDQRFALKAKEIVLRYADAYLHLPCQPEARVYKDSLHEGMWLANMAEACDLLYATDILTDSERRHIEQDMLRPATDELMQDRRSTRTSRNGHHQCYNFQTIHCAAVGRVGFLLNDSRYIEWALGEVQRTETPPDGQGIIDFGYGFRHLIKHDIRDDGLHWERSLGYHTYVTQYAVKLCEAALRNGIDLWHLEVPDDSTQDENGSGNYTLDGNNGPKSLKMMFDAPLYYAFGDLSTGAVADGGGEPLTRMAELYELAYKRYGDPHYAWLLQQCYRHRPGGLARRFAGPDTGKLPWNLADDLPAGTPPILISPDAARMPDQKFGTDGVVRCGSSLFPSSGFAILRQHPEDSNGLEALLTYGPLGGGHGHKDKLSLIVYHRGRQIVPALRTGSYDDPLHANWSIQTISHNTVTVDMQTQYPQGEWSRDSSHHPSMGALSFFHADSFAQMAQARCDNVYTGTTMERTLCLVDGVLLDVFALHSAESHTYDWAIRAPGSPRSDLTMSALSSPLSSDQGYQYLTHLKSATSAAPFACDFALNGEGVQVTMAGQPQTEFFLCEGPTDTKEATLPMLLARRHARSATFVTVFRPETDTRPVQIESHQTPEGLSVWLRIGAHNYVLALSNGKGSMTVSGLRLKGKAAIIALADGHVAQASVAGIQSLAEAGKATRRWISPHDVLLARATDGGLRVARSWTPVSLGGVFVPGTR
jgi:hypothetical protein